MISLASVKKVASLRAILTQFDPPTAETQRQQVGPGEAGGARGAEGAKGGRAVASGPMTQFGGRDGA